MTGRVEPASEATREATVTDLALLTVTEIVERFATGNQAERLAFVELCPPATLKEAAAAAAGMDKIEMRAQALDCLATAYATSGPYDLAAVLGEAAYRLGRRLYERGRGKRDSLRMIAGRGALNWISGLTRRGCRQEAIAALEDPIAWLSEVADGDNLDVLRLKRVELELDMERYDDAHRHLQEISEPALPPMLQVVHRTYQTLLEKRRGF